MGDYSTTFLKHFIKNFKQTGAIIPSSRFLSKKMVSRSDVEKSNVIVELGAGTGVFTTDIFSCDLEGKKVFIIEKNPEFYHLLLKKFPKYKKFIYNIDLLELKDLLARENVKNIDLLISGLPFKSLPKELFYFTLDEVVNCFFTEESKFIQFSYFKTLKKDFERYFEEINIGKCWLNLPPAYVYVCRKKKAFNPKK